MNKFFISILLLALILSKLYSQNFIFDPINLPSIPDTAAEIFLLSRNPALLNFDVEDERLNITSSFHSNKNQFKRFFVPERIDFYQIQFFGKKHIGETQIFKGQFGFSKEFRKNWNWIFTKDYKSGNTFLLGDSSSGNSVFNGILFDANYFNQLTEKFTIGAGLKYFVDEGIKQVSPKPTSQHREISISIGSTFSFLQNLKIGVSVNAEDKKEEISYKEDEGAVYKEITLFKFRGYDFPVAVKKKTETRISFHNLYLLNGDIIFEPTQWIKFFGNIKKGIEQILQKEEVTNPKSQGNFQNDYLKIRFNFSLKPIEKLSAIMGLEYFNSENWSRHPDFFTVVSDGNQNVIILKGNFTYFLSSNLSFNAGAGFGQLQFQLNDYYSEVNFDFKSHFYSLLGGLNINVFERIGMKILFSLEKYNPFVSNLKFSNPATYFMNYLKKDFDYFSAEFNKYEAGISFLIDLKIGEFIYDFNYRYYKHVNSFNRNNLVNTAFQSNLSFRKKVY